MLKFEYCVCVYDVVVYLVIVVGVGLVGFVVVIDFV